MSSTRKAELKDPALILKLSSLGMFVGSSFLAAPYAFAEDSNVTALPTITLAAKSDQGQYQAKKVTSNKYAEPLRDTPQSITVVSQQAIKDQNVQSLQDVLKNVAGITFMSGEGNLGWGDLFSIRGFSAEQSITVDGIRDAGMSNRSETFNTEQVEVFKGTGSVESGVSATGGSVNIASKKAHLGDNNHISMGLGTDQYYRATGDFNKQIGETSAVRINLMRHYNNVAERNVTNNDRWGGAIDLATGLGTDTRVHLSYLHQEDDNIPDGGVPIQRGTGGKRMPGVSRSAWYGDKNLYTDNTINNQTTFSIEHDVSDRLKISNISRYQQTDRLTILSPARFNNASGESYGYNASNYDSSAGYYTSSSPKASDGNAYLRLASVNTSKRYTIAANQTNINWKVQTGAIEHDVIGGLEVYKETYGDHARYANIPSKSSSSVPINLATQDSGISLGSKYSLIGGDTNKSQVDDVGVYLADTIKFTPQWLLNIGARFDQYNLKQYVTSSNVLYKYTDQNGVWSGRAGLTYKPVENGSIYIAYSQSQEPSAMGATTNNNIYGSTSSSTQTSDYSPAKAKTSELGTKWDLFNQKLSLTAALFRTELSDSWEYSDDSSSPIRSLPAKRVNGLELSANGNVTDNWSVIASYTYMDGKITKGINKGAEPKNLPKNSFSLWNTYAFTEKFNASLGLQYVGSRRYSDNLYVGGQSNNSSNALHNGTLVPTYVLDKERAPSYWLTSLAAHYKYNETWSVGLNVDNVFNTFYYSRIGASLDGYQIYGVPGAGRTFTATVDFHF